MTTLRIKQYSFHLDDPYTPGHALAANESLALNALRAENIRNNMAKRVQREIDALPDGTLLTQAQLEELQLAITDYASRYAFPLAENERKRLGALDIEIRDVAEELATARGLSPADAEWNETVEGLKLIPVVKTEALARLEAKQKIASASMDELLV